MMAREAAGPIEDTRVRDTWERVERREAATAAEAKAMARRRAALKGAAKQIDARTRAERGEIVPPLERIARSPEVVVGANKVIRLVEDPLERLYNRGELGRDGAGRKDADLNKVLYIAGERYREQWARSGFSGIQARDYRKPFAVDADGPPLMAATEGQAAYRSLFRRANQALGIFLAAVVDPVVIEGAALEEIGRKVSGRSDGAQARAVAIDRLIEGLRVLSVHYRLRKA